MSANIYVERRDASGHVIERVGPLIACSDAARIAIAGQMRIASLHNRSRYANDPSCQLVYEVEE